MPIDNRTPFQKKRRHLKRQAGSIVKKLGKLGYFEDCSYHPVRVTEIEYNDRDPYGAGVDGISLIDNKGSSCSIIYCGPRPMTKTEAEERVLFYNSAGKDAYLRKYVFEGDEEALKEYKEADLVWGFR